MLIDIMKGIESCQARGCWAFVQVGTTGVAIGRRKDRDGLCFYAPYLSLWTPSHALRFRRGKWAR
jgi:hypothetical protein